MRFYKRKALSALLVLAMLVTAFAGTAAAAGAGTTVYRNERQIADNLSYINAIQWNTNYGREESYTLKLTPGGDIAPIVVYGSRLWGANTIDTVTKYAAQQGYNVLGAINADFFDTSTGVPIGIVIRNGRLVTSDDWRPAVAFTEDGSAFLTDPKLAMTLVNEGGSPDADNAGKTVAVNHFNKLRQTTYVNLYSTDFGDTTKASGDCGEVLFKVLDGEPAVGGSVSLEVESVTEAAGATAIPDGYMILSIAKTSPYYGAIDSFAVGDRVVFTVSSGDERLLDAAWATGSGDILIDNGEITASSAWSSALQACNPRTAVGVKADGTVVFYVLDGRTSGHSGGVSMYQLASELKSMGCVYAMNLDGGGSTAMSLRIPGNSVSGVINVPSDGYQRSCSTYIVLVSSTASDGEAKYLSIKNDGALVIKNSQLDLGGVAATDAGYFPVETPADVKVTPSEGEVDGAVFYSGNESGGVSFKLSSKSTGAKGTGTVHVLSEVSSFTVTQQGGAEALTKLRLDNGSTVQLSENAVYYGRTVASTPSAYAYKADDAVGTVDQNGLFTASGEGGAQGTVTVTYGSVIRSFDVVINIDFVDIEGNWAKDYIDTLGDRGVITGYKTDAGYMFYPGNNITRQEFAVMLSRYLNIDQTQYNSLELPFEDVDAITWSSDYVKAMYSQGYMKGAQNGDKLYFNPAANITRAEICTILGRIYADDTSAVTLDFTDASQIPDWALDGVKAMVGRSVVGGYSDGTVRPLNNATRAEIAKILCTLGG